MSQRIAPSDGATVEATVRAVPEWIGATPDTPVPPRVRIRVFERYHGKCYLSGRRITPADVWEVEHIIAIINGGENRERNLAPAIKDKHRAKTDADLETKSKTARVRAKHLGIKKPSSFRNSTKYRGVDGRVRDRG